MWLRVVHELGLTNLSDDQVERYEHRTAVAEIFGHTNAFLRFVRYFVFWGLLGLTIVAPFVQLLLGRDIRVPERLALSLIIGALGALSSFIIVFLIDAWDRQQRQIAYEN